MTHARDTRAPKVESQELCTLDSFLSYHEIAIVPAVRQENLPEYLNALHYLEDMAVTYFAG